MRIPIDKTSDVPIHQQLRQQIIFRISTGEIPIGQVMPSVRELERRNKIHRNTLSSVYAELVEQHWLVRQRQRLVVVHPAGMAATDQGDGVDVLVERLLSAAQAEGLLPTQLAARINRRITAEPPDHFLIVELEPAMGAVLNHEVLKATGRKSVSYSVSELRRRPEILAEAALLVPAYLADLMEFVPARQRVAMTLLFYSPFGTHIDLMRNLSSPSMVVMLSVSGLGMRTMDGMFAEAIGSRHQLISFWMEWPLPNGKLVIRRVTSKQLPPDIDVRLLGHSGHGTADGSVKTPAVVWPTDLPMAAMEDLRAVDVLFCDSITYDAIRHPNRIKYRLLSPESLCEIAAVKLAAPRG